MDQPDSRDGPNTDLLDEVLAEYMRRMDRGEAVDRERFLYEHPEIADELRAYFRDCEELILGHTPSHMGRGEMSLAVDGDNTLPRRFGDYELLEELGRGGMGIVYKARQVSLNRVIALKMIRTGNLASAEEVQRFRREAEAAAHLDHPNITPLYEVGEHDGQHYFSMKLLDGGSLARSRREGMDRAKQRRLAALLAQVARAVHHAHQRGVLHRDLKPANILLDADGRPHVADFGLARWLDQPGGLSASRTIVGTPGYMAPEQVTGPGSAVTTAADVYGLGAVLYALLTGRPPFAGSGAMETLLQVKEQEPQRPRQVEPRIDRDLETICLTCLHKDPQRRYPSALAVAEDLERWLAGESILARPPGFVERLAKWARRQPAVAALTAGLFLSLTVLVAYLTWSQIILTQAVADKEGQRLEAIAAGEREKQSREQEQVFRAKAEREAYKALAREVKALRLAHPAGWRDETLKTLKQLAGMDTPERDPLALRGEAAACLGELDVRELLRWDVPGNWINELEFSPDGLTLAGAGQVGHLCLWEAGTGRLLHQVIGAPPRGMVPLAGKLWFPAVRFHPGGGSLVYSAGEQGPAFLGWPDRAAAVPALAASGTAQSFAFDRDGKLLAVGWGNSKVGIYDAATGAVRREVQLQAMPLLHLPMALHPHGDFVAAVDPIMVVKLFPLGLEKDPIILGDHADVVRSLCFSPDGRLLASASNDKTIKVWGVNSAVGKRWGEQLRLQGHRSSVNGVVFSPDGSLLASVGGDQTVRLWNLPSGQPLLTFDPGLGPVTAVAFDQSGARLAVAAQGVAVFQLVGRQQPLRLSVHYDVEALAFHPRQPVLLAGRTRMFRWDLGSNRPQPRPWKGVSLYPLVFGPDGKFVAAFDRANFALAHNQGAKTDPGYVCLLNPETGEVIKRLPGAGSSAVVVTLAIDLAGRRLASGAIDGWVTAWDVPAGQMLYHRKLSGEQVQAVAFLDPGTRLVASLADGEVILLDAVTGQECGRAHLAGGLRSLAVSPGGQLLAVAGRDGTLHVLTLPDLKPHAAREKAHEGGVLGVVFSPDGGYLVSGGADRRMLLWDAARLEPLCPLPTEDSACHRLAFSADGRRLAVAGASDTVLVYDLPHLRAELADLDLAWDLPEVR